MCQRFRFTHLLAACLLLSLGSSGRGAPVTWSGGAGAGNEQWSNINNFAPPGSPAGMDVTFNDMASAGASGVLTNIVDASVAVNDLNFTTAQNGTSSFHTTQINGGVTLTVNGDFTQGLGNPPCSFSGACNGDGTDVTITGPGALVYSNSSGNFLVGNYSGRFDRGARQDTLDMAGLTSFTMDANVWEIGRVGQTSPEARMTLADTNNISATLLEMAEWNDTGILELGRMNSINVDTFNLGFNVVNSATGRIRFDAGLVNPSVVIRDRAGTGGADLLMARPSQSNATGELDLTGGNVDAMFDQIEMGFGRPNQFSGNANGTITFDQGTMTANTVLLAQIRDLGNAGGFINLNGTANFSAGTIIMGDIIDNNGNGLTGTATARISLNGGTLQAAAIQPGAQLGDVVQPHVREIDFASGRIQNRASADLTIDPAIAVVLDTTGTHSVHADAGQSIIFDGVVSDTGPGATGLTIDGPGTVLLNAANTYTGETVVTNGTLGGTGSTAGPVTAAAGGTVGPGASAGVFTVDSFDLQTGGMLAIEIGGLAPGLGGHDQLIVLDDATLNGELLVSLTSGFAPSDTDTFTILTANNINGSPSNLASTGRIGVAGGGSFEFAIIGNQAVLSNFQIPEPSSGLLLCGGLAVLLRRRRNR